MADFKQWFVRERAKALSMLLLTRRSDLSVQDTKESNGLDYTVQVQGGESEGVRSFGVFLCATMSPVTLDAANKQLRPTLGMLKTGGPFPVPVCVFYFTAKDDRGYFTWAWEPVITGEGSPKLVPHSVADCRELNDEALNGVIVRINDWYNAYYEMIT